MNAMEHILDNPIWNGLQTGNRQFAAGNNSVKFFPLEISAAVGLRENTEQSLEILYDLLPSKREVILFSDRKIMIPEIWDKYDDRHLYQMVYKGTECPIDACKQLRKLDESNIEDMMELVKLAKPGAFFERTFEFGNYKGIFQEGKLIAMAGFRFKPSPYIEISAVCTHPDFVGRGFAAMVIKTLINDIITDGYIPYLHVAQTNLKAFQLYEKLGFRIRRELILYQLRRT